MSIGLILPTSMVMAIIAWSLIFVWYVHPLLRTRPFEAAVRPLLLLHSFRYIGLMFLIPGVVYYVNASSIFSRNQESIAD